MKQINIEKIDSYTPGLVITNEGKIIAMEEENHNRFFQEIIGREIMKLTGGIGKEATTKAGSNTEILRNLAKQANLKILFEILLKEFNYLPYQGCTSGNRIFNGGILYINPLEELTEEQLSTIVKLYHTVTSNYMMHIVKIGKEQENDEFITIEQIQDKLNQRKKK